MSHLVPWCACLSLACAGCHRDAPLAFRLFSAPTGPRHVDAKSKDPSDIYLAIGHEALAALPEPQSTTYTPGYRDSMRRKSAGLIDRLIAASSKPVVVAPRPRPMDDSMEIEAGWLRLAHAIAWTIEADINGGKTKSAIQLVIVAHRFGFDLTHGDIGQAQAGLTIADLARGAIAPHLSKFGSGDLKALADGMTQVVPRLASAEITLDAEKPDQLATMQAIQDAYIDKKALERFEKRAYNDTRDAWSYLRRMSEDERPKYFDQFAAEVDENMRFGLSEARKTQAERDPEVADWLKAKTKTKYRPWKRLMPHYFSAWQPYLDQRDLTLARTRLLGLTCLVVKGIKDTGAAPDVMSCAPESLRIDPFSGKDFGYARASSDFKLYSVGADGRDDGGSSDGSGTTPDVQLSGLNSGL